MVCEGSFCVPRDSVYRYEEGEAVKDSTKKVDGKLNEEVMPALSIVQILRERGEQAGPGARQVEDDEESEHVSGRNVGIALDVARRTRADSGGTISGRRGCRRAD